MEQGIIKWFDNKKGFGFIARQGGGQDIFVHFSSINGEGFKTLEEGDRVEYEAGESDKGLKASRVVKLENAGRENGGASANGNGSFSAPARGTEVSSMERDAGGTIQ